MGSTIKILQEDWNIEQKKRSEIADLTRTVNQEVGSIKVATVTGILFLAHIADNSPDEFDELLLFLSDRNFETFKQSVSLVNNCLQSKFKPTPDQLAPITELTQMKQITSDDDENARVEFENNSPNQQFEGILRAEIAGEEE